MDQRRSQMRMQFCHEVWANHIHGLIEITVILKILSQSRHIISLKRISMMTVSTAISAVTIKSRAAVSVYSKGAVMDLLSQINEGHVEYYLYFIYLSITRLMKYVSVMTLILGIPEKGDIPYQ